MNALIICDDFYHPGGIIEEGLSFLKPEWELKIMTDMSKEDLTSLPLNGFDVIILCKDNEISNENLNGWLNDTIINKFLEFTENGGGFAAMHAGSVSCKRSAALKNLVGCEFMSHPDQCPVEYYSVPEINDSITKNVNPFTETDEHYVIDISAGDANIFLYGKSENGNLPAGYTRFYGKGRVLALTPGHNLPVWQNAEYKKLIKNALNWCAGKGNAKTL